MYLCSQLTCATFISFGPRHLSLCVWKENQDSDIYVIFTFYVVVDISKQHLKYELCFMYSTKRDKKLLNLTLYKEDKADKAVSIQQAGRI